MSAPITPDNLTIPRKDVATKPTLIGLTRASMRDALIEIGTPEKQAKMRVRQMWHWLYSTVNRKIVV